MHKLSKSYVDICAIYHQVMALFCPQNFAHMIIFSLPTNEQCNEAAAARHKLRGGQRILAIIFLYKWRIFYMRNCLEWHLK